MTGVPAISERDFQRQVTDLAEILGWEFVHFRPAQTSKGWRTPVSGSLGKGWPDLFLARAKFMDRRIIFAELKRDGGKLTQEQERVRTLLVDIGLSIALDSGWVTNPQLRQIHPKVEYHVWRPSDFDAITEVLR